jgi:hypothetical protein
MREQKDIVELLNERETVELDELLPEVPPPGAGPGSSASDEPASGASPESEADYADEPEPEDWDGAGDEFDDYELIDESDEKPGILDELESWGEEEHDEEQFSEAEMKAFGDLLVGLVHTTKDMTNLFFDTRFHEALSKRFSEKEMEAVELVMFLDQDGNLGSNNLPEMRSLAQEFGLEMKTLVSVAVRYRQVKKRYQASEFKEYQQEGIRKYATQVAKRHMLKPDPVLMLGLYLAVTLGADLGRIGMAMWNDRKQKANE